ncbi:MAG: hypothetical protein HGB17_09295 [Syntrophobacteraceae bacterium]|nr:hypothetical protein [Syntrophobacteraceae bacterium]
MTKILLVMLGGSLGALSRYGVALLAVKLFGGRFPYGTLIVNLSGCFLIGLSLKEQSMNSKENVESQGVNVLKGSFTLAWWSVPVRRARRD